MNLELRALVAANIASGLVAKHGIDHGGLSAEKIASRSLAIGDEILHQISGDKQPEPFSEPQPPAPLGNSGAAAGEPNQSSGLAPSSTIVTGDDSGSEAAA